MSAVVMGGEARSTRFGEMHELELPFELSGQIEVMTFTKRGSPHAHDVDELALVTMGVCDVHIGEETVRLRGGRYVVIPAGVSHWMEPVGGAAGYVVFVIGYRRSA